jgi:ubiquinone/menaquinone biosynthesis C-methylase UbiE
MSENIQKNITRFDKVADSWDKKPRRVELANAISRTMIAELSLNKNMNAMEFGCGTGLISINLADKLGKITAIDNSSKMLDVLTSKLAEFDINNIYPQKLDVINQGLDISQKFDLIFICMTLHHIEDINSLLKLFKSVLNPNGIVAIADLDQEDGNFHDDNDGIAHFGFDQIKLTNLLENLGFSGIKATIAHNMTKNNKNYPIFLMCGKVEG